MSEEEQVEPHEGNHKIMKRMIVMTAKKKEQRIINLLIFMNDSIK